MAARTYFRMCTSGDKNGCTDIAPHKDMVKMMLGPDGANVQDISGAVCTCHTGPVFSYKLRYIVGFGLVEMAISTNPKPTIYRNLYENTDPDNCNVQKCSQIVATGSSANALCVSLMSVFFSLLPIVI